MTAAITALATLTTKFRRTISIMAVLALAFNPVMPLVSLMPVSATSTPQYVNQPLDQAELDSNWTADRQLPSGGHTSTTFDGRDDVLEMNIDNTNASTSGAFYTTEGLKRALPGQTEAIKADLYLDNNWQSNNTDVRAGIWGVGSDSDGDISAYPILEFTTVGDSGHVGWRYFDDANGGWTNVSGSVTWGEWVTAEVIFNETTTSFDLYLDGDKVGSNATTGSVELSDVILNSKNFATNNTGDDYSVHWSQFAFGTLPGPVYRDDGSGNAEEYFDTLQAAINDNDGLNGGDGSTDPGDTLVIADDLTTSSQVTVNKSLTIKGDGHSITPSFTKTNNSNNSVIGIIGTSDVTIIDLIVNGNNEDLHGVNVYESTNIQLTNLTSSDNRAGIIVNGSTVSAHNLTTSGNSWYGVNIDQGGGVTRPAEFTATGSLNHDEAAHVVLEDSTNTDLGFNDPENQYFKTSLGNVDVYNLRDPSDEHRLNLSGSLYRDAALNDCDNRTECLNRTNDMLEDWTVKLFKEDSSGSWQLVDTDTTDADGIYKFASQTDAGTYHVCEVVKDGWTQQVQNWSGSGYLVNTDSNPAGDSELGPYCTTTTYSDTADRSSKSKIGNVDTGNPETTFLTPSNLDVVNSTDVTGTITDNHDIAQYSFNINGPGSNNWSTSKWAPGADTVNFDLNLCESDRLGSCDESTLPNGEYKVRVAAYDGNGNRDISTNVTFVLDNDAPGVGEIKLNDTTVGPSHVRTANCQQPTYFHPVSGVIDLSAVITDDPAGVASTFYKVRKVSDGGCTQSGIFSSRNVNMTDSGDDTWQAVSGNEFDTNDIGSEGKYTIMLVTKDQIGNQTTKYIDIHVDNTEPEIVDESYSFDGGIFTVVHQVGTPNAPLLAPDVTDNFSSEAELDYWWELIESQPTKLSPIPNDEPTLQLDPGPVGSYQLLLTVTDQAGNQAQVTYDVTVTPADPAPSQNANANSGSNNGQSDQPNPGNAQGPLAFTNTAGGQIVTTDDATDGEELGAAVENVADDESGDVLQFDDGEEADEANTDDDGGMPWWWWLVILAVLGGGWWLFAARRSSNN